MKLIAFKAYGNWQTRAVLKMVMNTNPRGMLLDEMRKRINIMDAIDATDDAAISMIVDDDQFRLVADAFKGFPFGVAHKDLLALIDDVLASKEPPIVMLNGASKKKRGREGDEAASSVGRPSESA